MDQGKGLLLDFDGTVADSLVALKAVYAAVVEMLGERGRSAPRFEEFNGVPLAEIAARLTAGTGNAADFHHLHREKARAVYDTVAPNPGVHATLQHAVQRGWLPVIVTSNERSVVARWLERTGLSDFVVDIVAVEDVTHGKPDPEPYRLALSRIARSPDQALAVEDGAIGAQSAYRAGVATVGYGPAPSDDGWPILVGRITSFEQLCTWL